VRSEEEAGDFFMPISLFIEGDRKTQQLFLAILPSMRMSISYASLHSSELPKE
jgi:hypothetical protein